MRRVGSGNRFRKQSCEGFLLDPLRERPEVHLGWAIIDSKCPGLAEHLLDDCIARDSGPTHYLYAVVGDPEERLGHRDLCHRRFGNAEGAAVERVSAPVDDEFTLFDGYLVLRQLEADALVVNQ